MLKAGDLLKTARLKKKLTYTSVSSKLKLPVNTIKALERNQYKKLPAYTYILGFIKNYAKLLGLDPNKTTAVFKRDYQKSKKKIIPKGLTKPLNSPWQPSSSIRNIITAIIIGLLFTSYLALSFYKLNRPPKLIVFKPKNGQTLATPVLIKGKTNHDATLTLNGKIINLESDGNFTTVFNGLSGAQELKLKSTSRRQKSTQTTLHLIIK
ncbi:MAG: helix-turn-helix transcriptional regulator [Patescibacteria group bacterium]|nr:helix-turn-helix transcriptional regulator [Patescibacteria group bacterium]